MKTQTITLYSFSELSEEAKEKAIQNWRNSDCVNTDYEWQAETVLDDAKEIGKLFGLDIENIYYSGFWSQGDGASFTGHYSYRKGALKAVKEYAPGDAELHGIVEQLQELQRRYFYRLSANITQSGHYCHEMTMRFNVSCGNYDANGDCEETLAEIMRDYARWIYKRLEKEYEYVTSDDFIKETIEANDYDFLEDGTMY